MQYQFPYRYRVLVLLFFLTLITYLDRVCISVVGVRIKTEFHLTNEQFGWVLGAFSLAYALFEIPSGILGDRIGQRAVFIRIVLWWSLFTVLTGFTTGLASLIIVRFLFGMGESGAYPTSSAVISRWFPATETGRSMSALFVGQNAGAAIAPLIVIPVAIGLGWRASFYVNGTIGLLWVLVCFLWFKNNPSEVKGVSDEERNFIERNRRFVNHKQPFSWKIVLKNRSLRALVGQLFCSQWAQYFFIAWMPVYLQEGKHFSENGMKTVTSYFFIIGIVGVLSAGFLIDFLVKRKGLRFGRRFFGMIPLSLLALSFLIIALTENDVVVVVCLYLAQLFYSFNPLVSFSTCVDIGGDRVGTIAGIMNFCGQIGAFLLAIVFGKIADLTHNFSAPIFIIAGVLFTGSLLWLFIDPAKPVVKA
ncbi:MAG: MFS transporter [Bacteroidetes bacterium]|nr:MAG: MFS transporter [Bacteroidota bacterium]